MNGISIRNWLAGLAVAASIAAVGAILTGIGSATAHPARGQAKPDLTLAPDQVATEASCVGLTPSEQRTAAKVIVIGRMLPGASTQVRNRQVLLSPAKLRVSHYLKGSGPRTVKVHTGVGSFNGRFEMQEDGILPSAGQRWEILSSSRSAPLQTSVCLGSRRLTAAPVRSAERVREVLGAAGIGTVRFGASPGTVRALVTQLLGQKGGAYKPTNVSCGLDHEITWSDDHTANGLPVLTAYFGESKFVGYQYGEYGTMIPPHAPASGVALATGRDLRVGDSMARGRKLYGKAFTISAAQGGTWSVRVARRVISGYAWGKPKHGDVNWQSLVATIDAGDVGCAAAAP